MKRIILHWTAGAYTPNSVDLAAYHFVIAGDGTVVKGKHPVSANAAGKPLISGRYAAHTASLNTDSIGVSLAAMAGAQESPFNAGRYPVTPAQVAALVKLTADLSTQYGIPITPQTVLTHAEVQGTLKVKQKNKWDITYLPGYGKRSATEIGNILRQMVATYKASHAAAGIVSEIAPVIKSTGFKSWLSRLFGGK